MGAAAPLTYTPTKPMNETTYKFGFGETAQLVENLTSAAKTSLVLVYVFVWFQIFLIAS